MTMTSEMWKDIHATEQRSKALWRQFWAAVFVAAGLPTVDHTQPWIAGFKNREHADTLDAYVRGLGLPVRRIDADVKGACGQWLVVIPEEDVCGWRGDKTWPPVETTADCSAAG